MRILLFSLGGLTLAFLAVLAAGFALPATRQGSSERLLPAPPERVAATLLDVESQPRWRPGIVAVERTDDGWAETTDRGEVIVFRLGSNEADRIQLRFESSRGYHGTWVGELVERDGATYLQVTETASTPSPLGRILSRLFFDPETYAKTYLDALEAEVKRREVTS
jgi:hypothetical protein